ncbi:MAG: DUF1552 domain-containing protein [Planctomycetaceae bacterium]|nr:DUF1552 domain-containing protein [Planctomycetaceae bacterium]
MNPSDRRTFLKGTSANLALPMLESTRAALGATHEKDPASEPKRLVCVGVYLGFYQKDFFPAKTGHHYDISPVLEPIEGYREEMTIFSGLDHRGRHGHEGWRAWMSGRATGSVSMDQLVADHVGDQTRFASMQLTCGSPPGDAKLSFTKEGVALPMIGRPSVLYETLFRSGSDKARMEYLLKTNRSVLDGLSEETRALERTVTSKDREKLGEYFASVRDVEKKLQKQQLWLDRPTPKVDYPLPEFDPVAPDVALECESIMYDLMALALTTDSTRVLTFLIPGWSQVFTINNRKLSAGYHSLSHHGNEVAKIAEYNMVGREHVKRLGGFLDKLKANKDADDRPLLDTTTVLYGSGMGDANTHDNSNLPTLLVGGGLRHGQHHQIDRGAASPRLLGDLYLTLMQQFGVQSEQFAGATSNMNEYLL